MFDHSKQVVTHNKNSRMELELYLSLCNLTKEVEVASVANTDSVNL